MKFFFISFILIVLSCGLFGQKPYSIHLDKSNGLPCNEIYNLHQDKKGFIWIASDLGLYRYDGFEYRSHAATNMSSKSGSYIHEDERGRIWYSTFDAKLFYIENDTLKPFENERTLAQTVEYGIIGNKLIALERKNNLLIIDINTGKLLKEIPNRNFYSSLYQYEKMFSLGDGNSVRFMNEDGKVIISLQAERGNVIYKVIPYKNKFYSLECSGNSTEIFEIINSTKKKIYSEPLDMNINGFFLVDSQLFILKKQGISQLDINTYICNNNLLKNTSASHIIKDNNGYIWISSSFDGIYTFPSAASYISYDLPIFNCKIRIVDNNFIFFNAKGEVYAFDMTKTAFKKILIDKTKSTIYDVIPFEKSKLDASFANENYSIASFQNADLLILKSGVKEIQKINTKYIASAVTGFAGLQQINYSAGNEWDSIAYRYRDTIFSKNKKFVTSGFIDNVRTKSVTYNHLDKTIYFATNLGIITATPKLISELLYKGQKIYASKMTNYEGVIYTFLHSGEILTKQKTADVVLENGLNMYAPYQFFKLQDSLLFLGTTKELFYVNLKNKEYEFKLIPFSMLISELNDIVLYEDHFYLSVNNQLIKISKSSIAKHSEIPFYINYIESNKNRYYYTTGIQLDANEKDVKINFSALDYFQNSPGILYKINNEAWRKSDAGSRTILLASLAPDDYSISFSINEKLYNNIVQFTINKPWYQRWWFIVLVLCTIICFSFLYYKNRLASNKKESDLLLEKANLEKDLRQSMLSSIKSQMNPHFLFNALNTIQSYIITEDKVNASNYLSKFSKLTRKILEMSDKETISLQEEIDALLLYIELEKMRFQELNYTIEIEKDIETKSIFIPSMIIQPYVENAIKHGLLHKTGDKQLFIGISKTNEHLMIHIEDNGIGRQKSESINNNKSETHRSFASHANMKRVELLNIEKNEIGIEYIDKKNQDGEGAGTIINIKIPIKANI